MHQNHSLKYYMQEVIQLVMSTTYVNKCSVLTGKQYGVVHKERGSDHPNNDKGSIMCIIPSEGFWK